MRTTRIKKALLVVFVNLVVLEAASFASVHALALVSPNRRLDLFLEERLGGVPDTALAEFHAGGYDAELGWDNPPNKVVTQRNTLGRPWTATYDASGARRSCLPTAAATPPPPAIATYGDSFTRGDEVDDGDTWQCEIERRIGQRVANYGVGGYDVGQAILKAERDWNAGRAAPITILGIYAEDLDRTLNRYRPYFDSSSSGMFGFKPSFRVVEGEVALVPNPLDASVTSVAALHDLAISVADTDYWAQQWARVLPEFPYTLQIARTGRYMIASRLGTPHYLVNTWDTDEGRAVISYLLHRFAAGARRHGTRPVVLLLPETFEWQHGRTKPQYRDFVEHDLRDAGLDLTIVDVANAEFDESRFSIAPFTGHASPYGNRVIAGALLSEIGDELHATHERHSK